MAEQQTVSLKIGSYSESSLATIECLTLLHVGTGRGASGSPIDLPIQRDAFEFPMISGSSLKGPIRQLFKKVKTKDGKIEEVSEVFGKETQDRDETDGYYAGAVLILDARLLSIPVRSLKGIYVQATCPYMLSNFVTYAKVCKESKYTELSELLKKIEPKERHLLMAPEALEEISLQLKFEDKSVILGDDGIYKAEPSTAVERIADLLGPNLLGPNRKKLVVCHDNDMHDHILKRAVVVTQRIKIDGDTKTVSPGGLWTEENLPQESRFVTALFYSDSRKTGSKKAQEIKKALEEIIEKQGSMIFGGDETVGRGLCKITFLKSY